MPVARLCALPIALCAVMVLATLYGTVSLAPAVVLVAFVYPLARTAGRTPVVTLLLAGFVVSSFLISATSFIMITSNRVNQVTLWTMGGIDISRYQQLAFTGPCVLIAVCLAVI